MSANVPPTSFVTFPQLCVQLFDLSHLFTSQESSGKQRLLSVVTTICQPGEAVTDVWWGVIVKISLSTPSTHTQVGLSLLFINLIFACLWFHFQTKKRKIL